MAPYGQKSIAYFDLKNNNKQTKTKYLIIEHFKCCIESRENSTANLISYNDHHGKSISSIPYPGFFGKQSQTSFHLKILQYASSRLSLKKQKQKQKQQNTNAVIGKQNKLSFLNDKYLVRSPFPNYLFSPDCFSDAGVSFCWVTLLTRTFIIWPLPSFSGSVCESFFFFSFP